jgi:hypothetical protein
MLNRKSNILIIITLAVIAVCMGIQTSLANLNRDLGYQQPQEALDYQQTIDGWHFSFLNIPVEVQKDQVAKVVQPVTNAIHNFPVEELEQYQQIALDKAATWWQQAINSNPVETVRCLTNNIIDKVDSR